MKNIMILIFLALMSCDNKTEHGESLMMGDIADNFMEEEESIPITSQAPFRSVSNSGDIERKTITIANLSMQVENLDSTAGKLDKILHRYNAYVNANSRNNETEILSLNMTIRVNQDQLNGLLSKISQLASYIHYNNSNSQDVTEEFVDINIRLKNKKAVEQQYLELLKRVTKIEDILKIENELRVIREEIEAKEGRLKYLSDQVKMSTIHLHAYQEIFNVKEAPAQSFWLTIKQNFSDGWDLLKTIFSIIVRIWPVWVMIITAIYVIRKRLYPKI